MALFLSYFRGLIDKDCDITVELKNGLTITGKLKFIDNNMCLQLEDIHVKQSERFPQFASIKNLFIRGSTIRYIQMPYVQQDIESLMQTCVKQ